MLTSRTAHTFRAAHDDFSATLVHPSVYALENLVESLIRSVHFDMNHCFGLDWILKHVSLSKYGYSFFAEQP